MTKRANAAHFKAIRKELAEELGYDPDNLSTLESMRVDVIFGLKSSLDEMRARMFDGEKVDTNEMRQIADTLEKYLPRHAQPDPTPAIFRQDPYKVMDDIVDRWIAADEADRRERGLSPRVHDPEEQQARTDELERENARLRGESVSHVRQLPAPEADGAPITPPDGDVVGPLEQSDRQLYRGGPRPGPDSHKAAPKPIIDIDAKPEGSWTGPKDGPPPWLRKTPPVEKRVAEPIVTKSGDETKAAMARVNNDR